MKLLDHYSEFRRAFHTCKHCGWHGKGTSFTNGSYNSLGINKHCPKCGERHCFAKFSCTWTVEERQKQAPRRDKKTSKLADQLVEYLDTYAGERLSVRALKVDTGLEEVHRNTFKCALDAALSRLEDWQHEGRSVART